MKNITNKKLQELADLYFSSGSKVRKDINDYLWGFWHSRIGYYRRSTRIKQEDALSFAFMAMYDALEELFVKDTPKYLKTLSRLSQRSVSLYRAYCVDHAQELKGDKKKMHKGLSRNVAFRVYDHKKQKFTKIKLDDFTTQNVKSSVELLIDLSKDPEQNYIMIETMGIVEKWFDKHGDEQMREVFFRVHMDGDSTQDVADEIGIPYGTLKVRLNAMRNELKTFMEKKDCTFPNNEYNENIHRLFDSYQTPNDNIDATLYGTAIYETFQLRRKG